MDTLKISSDQAKGKSTVFSFRALFIILSTTKACWQKPALLVDGHCTMLHSLSIPSNFQKDHSPLVTKTQVEKHQRYPSNKMCECLIIIAIYSMSTQAHLWYQVLCSSWFATGECIHLNVGIVLHLLVLTQLATTSQHQLFDKEE